MRATATALLYLTVNLFGAGLGPPVTGFLSDRIAAASFAGGQYATTCRVLSAADKACFAASATGVRWALVAAACAFLWASVHYLLAARTLRDDLQDETETPSAK